MKFDAKRIMDAREHWDDSRSPERSMGEILSEQEWIETFRHYGTASQSRELGQVLPHEAKLLADRRALLAQRDALLEACEMGTGVPAGPYDDNGPEMLRHVAEHYRSEGLRAIAAALDAKADAEETAIAAAREREQ
jgi:hypothetical protein